MTSVREPERYKLSFSVGGLFMQGARTAAGLYQDRQDWSAVRSALDSGNLLQARTASTAKRWSYEIVQRMEELTSSEVRLLLEGTWEESSQLMWAATCRHYEIVGDFAEEVLRERFLLLHQDIGPEHFDSFVRAKSLWHEELVELENSTLQKLRSTLFLMLRESELITGAGIIVPAVISMRLREQFGKRSPSDLRFFPVRDIA